MIGVVESSVEVSIDRRDGEVFDVFVQLRGVPHGQAESVVGAVVVCFTIAHFVGRNFVSPACNNR